MNWLILVLAGVLEVVWATSLKYTFGFTKLVPTLITAAAMLASFYLLALALKTLPLGSGYGVWVGIGAVGTAIVGIIVFKEPVSMLKIASVLMVMLGIAGLKLSSP